MNTLPMYNQEKSLSSNIQNETLYKYPTKIDNKKMSQNNTKYDNNTINIIENKRTVIDLKEPDRDNLPKYILGNTLYIVVFVIIIPAFMVHQQFSKDIILAYLPNVDMLATILGYDGGPMNMWRYLYNPNNFTLFGFVNTTFINYIALLGLTYIIATTTLEKRSWEYGWSGAFVMILCTYLIPGNPVVLIQNKIEEKLVLLGFKKDFDTTYVKTKIYIFMISIGIALAILIILFEAALIKLFRPHIINMIKYVAWKLK